VAERHETESNLSQAELDSLFESMQVARLRGRDTGADDATTVVTLYDFRQASKLSPDQIREVREVLHGLIRVLRRTLGVYLNAPAWVELQALSQGPGEQYLSNLPDQPMAALFELLPHTPKAAWQIDGPLAHAATHCMLGGRADKVDPQPERELSPVEGAVLGRFFREVLDTWAITWPLLRQRETQVCGIVSNITQLDMELRREQMLMALFEASIAGQEGRMWVGLPAGVLQTILRRAEAAEGERPISPTLLRSTGRTPVELKVNLAQRQMWLSELKRLRPGDVIDLQQHTSDPVGLYLAGKRKFLARTGVQRGRVAVEIVDVPETG
jgi:flagellar motor switch protein FliM